jgi:hypothetical protein
LVKKWSGFWTSELVFVIRKNEVEISKRIIVTSLSEVDIPGDFFKIITSEEEVLVNDESTCRFKSGGKCLERFRVILYESGIFVWRASS